MKWLFTWKIAYFCHSSLFVFGSFSCSFNWDKFLCIFILLKFSYIYEIRWNRFLLWSWRNVLGWSHIYTVCKCPVALGGRDRFDVNTNHLSPEYLEAKARASCTGSSLLCPSPPYWGYSHIPGCCNRSPEDQSIGSKNRPWKSYPLREQCWSTRGWCGHLACSWNRLWWSDPRLRPRLVLMHRLYKHQ